METPLPDPLVLPNGKVASNAEEWFDRCRPRLFAFLQSEEYGAIPSAPQETSHAVVRRDPNALGGRATLQEIDIETVSPGSHLHLLLIAPNAVSSPACFLGLNFRGNHAVLNDPAIRAPQYKIEKGVDIESERGSDLQTWCVETIIDRGYAFATLYNGDAIPDDADAARVRLADFVAPGMSVSDGGAPATIACWAWALSRAIDYLADSEDVDGKRIAIVGQSRNGKTALLAGAFDERAAMVIASQSGCGGAGPSRNIGEDWNLRETVERINAAFPHWFCENFKRYNTNPDHLPFDQHALIALCAPRPFLLSSATEDLWANPLGSFEMLRAADPAYRLLTDQGVDEAVMPEPGRLLKTRLGHFLRAGRHAMTAEDWAAWLDYADVWL